MIKKIKKKKKKQTKAPTLKKYSCFRLNFQLCPVEYCHWRETMGLLEALAPSISQISQDQINLSPCLENSVSLRSSKNKHTFYLSFFLNDFYFFSIQEQWLLEICCLHNKYQSSSQRK